MTTKEKLESRRFVIKVALQSVSRDKATKKGIMDVCNVVGAALGIPAQTVYNYTKGRIADGYLADAILTELKSYKPSKTKSENPNVQ